MAELILPHCPGCRRLEETALTLAGPYEGDELTIFQKQRSNIPGAPGYWIMCEECGHIITWIPEREEGTPHA